VIWLISKANVFVATGG
jgi:hypothetical protein